MDDILVETNAGDAVWRSCCFEIDRNAVKFVTQVCFGASVIVFSMCQIARGVDNQEIYFSMLSGTLGLFLPHPNLKSET
jgi:hypothetical protein